MKKDEWSYEQSLSVPPRKTTKAQLRMTGGYDEKVNSIMTQEKSGLLPRLTGRI